MRVISGKKKGMKLLSTKDSYTRPTEDRIKESIFNSLFSIEEGSKALDLFAGTGGIGIEFLSRGCDFAVFCDKSRTNINCIKENLKKTDLLNNAKIFHGDNERNLFNIKAENMKFDYIFLDPPYNQINLYYDSLEFIKENSLLNEDGIVIVESEQELEIEYYDIIKIKEYGKKIIYFLGLGE
ncbi:16S rRNA (guanine(966)-N(2))-methyltransferase RsmD [Lagierella massiliensis]|uniref:16S rRNA (guanine(966)-N(2))-methyltransferase RsmD n=1 Tax=Lagierella massiliensis TaxID=1689303 RepID=UPI0006D777A0|nr:16S rRNA (guanine(966)-N(2))-methyltransferase RsmD [Lagierella massiliensis]